MNRSSLKKFFEFSNLESYLEEVTQQDISNIENIFIELSDSEECDSVEVEKYNGEIGEGVSRHSYNHIFVMSGLLGKIFPRKKSKNSKFVDPELYQFIVPHTIMVTLRNLSKRSTNLDPYIERSFQLVGVEYVFFCTPYPNRDDIVLFFVKNSKEIRKKLKDIFDNS